MYADMRLFALHQVRSPKDQYLLLRALDEVLASLLTLPDGVARLHEATGDKVIFTAAFGVV